VRRPSRLTEMAPREVGSGFAPGSHLRSVHQVHSRRNGPRPCMAVDIRPPRTKPFRAWHEAFRKQRRSSLPIDQE
jgi:hypothetical protein